MPNEMTIYIAIGAVVCLFVLPKLFSSPAPVFREGEDINARLQEFLIKGEKLNAIRAYRKLHGGDLKDTKEAVELMLKGGSPTVPASGARTSALTSEEFSDELKNCIAEVMLDTQSLSSP